MTMQHLSTDQKSLITGLLGLVVCVVFADGPMLLALLGILVMGPIGLFRWFFRSSLRRTRWFENEYALQRWQHQFETPFGQFSSWYLGVDREGRIKA